MEDTNTEISDTELEMPFSEECFEQLLAHLDEKMDPDRDEDAERDARDELTGLDQRYMHTKAFLDGRGKWSDEAAQWLESQDGYWDEEVLLNVVHDYDSRLRRAMAEGRLGNGVEMLENGDLIKWVPGDCEKPWEEVALMVERGSESRYEASEELGELLDRIEASTTPPSLKSEFFRGLMMGRLDALRWTLGDDWEEPSPEPFIKPFHWLKTRKHGFKRVLLTLLP